MLPKVLDVPGFEAFLGRPLAEEAAPRSLAFDPTALRGIREYRAGDPLRAINWRATARVGALQTNEFEPASLAAVRLLLDVGVLQNAWQGIGPERMELLCVVTASLAGAFAAQGFGVGLASNARLTGDWRAADIEPAHGTLPEILEMLARVHLFTARDFDRMLAVEIADEGSHAECLVVTAALRESARDRLALLRAERTDQGRLCGATDRGRGAIRRRRRAGRVRLEDERCAPAPRLTSPAWRWAPGSKACGVAPGGGVASRRRRRGPCG